MPTLLNSCFLTDLVQEFRGKICTIGPGDRLGFWVDCHLLKISQGFEGFKNFPVKFSF